MQFFLFKKNWKSAKILNKKEEDYEFEKCEIRCKNRRVPELDISVSKGQREEVSPAVLILSCIQQQAVGSERLEAHHHADVTTHVMNLPQQHVRRAREWRDWTAFSCQSTTTQKRPVQARHPRRSHIPTDPSFGSPYRFCFILEIRRCYAVYGRYREWRFDLTSEW